MQNNTRKRKGANRSPKNTTTTTTTTSSFENLQAEIEQLRRDNELLRQQQTQSTPTSTVISPDSRNLLINNSTTNSNNGAMLRMSLMEARTLIPIFEPSKDSTTAEEWVRIVESIQNIYGWDNLSTMFYAGCQLRGAANSWYNINRIHLADWAQFKRKFIDGFPTVENHSEVLNKLLTRQRQLQEGVESYFYSVVGLCQKLHITEKESIKYVISGLNNKDLSLRVEAAKPATLQDTLKEIKEGESMNDHNRMREQYQNPAHSTNAYTRNNNTRDESFKIYPNKRPYNSNFNSNFQYNNYNKYTQGPNRVNDKFQANNNNPVNNTNNMKPNNRCYRCGKIGHMSFECYKHPKIQNKDQHKMQAIKNTEEHNNDCYQKVKVDEVELDSFVDLGSDCTTIQVSVVDKLNWPYNKSGVVLKGFGGGSYETFGSLDKVIEINDIKLMTNLTVVDDSFQDVSILIGRNFLNHPSVMVIKRFGTLIIKKDCTTAAVEPQRNNTQSKQMMLIKKKIELEDVSFGAEANIAEKNLLINVLNQHRNAADKLKPWCKFTDISFAEISSDEEKN